MQPTNNTKSKLRKAFLAALLLLVAGWGVACAALYRAMRRPPEAFARVMSRLPGAVFLMFPFETMWTHARAGALHPGDAAPDFSLMKLDHSEKVRLANLAAEHPVVLVFGSYT